MNTAIISLAISILSLAVAVSVCMRMINRAYKEIERLEKLIDLHTDNIIILLKKTGVYPKSDTDRGDD